MCNDFPFLYSKSLEEERLDRSKFQEYLSSLFAVLLLLTINWCLLKQQDLGTVIIIKLDIMADIM